MCKNYRARSQRYVNWCNRGRYLGRVDQDNTSWIHKDMGNFTLAKLEDPTAKLYNKKNKIQ
jgi:hypothetical protein